jgi:glycosyltransferase involved in cell wall biosynthesis
LFSVVTICFNNRELLQRTAQSVSAQTMKHFEWILIDGGSTDGTVEDISGYRRLSSWVSEPDEGIADAWNKGIRRATGQQVVILNAGDVFDAECLAVMSQKVSRDRITCCHARLSTEAGVARGTFLARPDKLWRGMHLPHNWAFVPRHFYQSQELGLYRKLRHSMDFEWFHRFYKRYGDAGFQVVDQVLGTYYLGGLSDGAFLQSFKTNEAILRENGTSPLFSRALRWVYSTKHGIVHRILPKIKRMLP